MKNINDLEKEFKDLVNNMTDTCSIEFALAYVRHAITSAFEETRVEEFYIQSHDGNIDFETGFNSALNKIKNNQELFLKKDL